MDSSERGALALVRLVAGCIIVLGLMDAGIYFTEYLMPYAGVEHHDAPQHRQAISILRIVLDSIPIIVGIVILVKAKAIAVWLSDWIQ